MKIVILNGDISTGKSNFSAFLEELSHAFGLNNDVQLFSLNKMNLHYCTGCWSCWWKTPGRCSINDDADEIF